LEINVNKNLVEKILQKLKNKFGTESPITTSLGKFLEYLGMTIDYKNQEK